MSKEPPLCQSILSYYRYDLFHFDTIRYDLHSIKTVEVIKNQKVEIDINSDGNMDTITCINDSTCGGQFINTLFTICFNTDKEELPSHSNSTLKFESQLSLWGDYPLTELPEQYEGGPIVLRYVSTTPIIIDDEYYLEMKSTDPAWADFPWDVAYRHDGYPVWKWLIISKVNSDYEVEDICYFCRFPTYKKIHIVE